MVCSRRRSLLHAVLVHDSSRFACVALLNHDPRILVEIRWLVPLDSVQFCPQRPGQFKITPHALDETFAGFVAGERLFVHLASADLL